MTFEELKAHLVEAAENNTLITPKHDPKALESKKDKFRSVVSYEVTDNLKSFIASGNYSVRQFDNTKFPATPLYFEITPDPDTGFDIPASGVTAYSNTPTSQMDRLIAVSGLSQGWHLSGEDRSIIDQKVSTGQLIFIKEL